MSEQQDNTSTSSEASTLGFYNEKQVKVLRAIFGTFIGELDDSETETLMETNSKVVFTNAQNVRELAKFDLSVRDDFLERIIEKLRKRIPADRVQQLKWFIKLLCKGVTSLPLTGYSKPFYELSRKQREAVLLKWSTSSTAVYRKVYRSLYLLTCNSFWRAPYNFYPAIGYPGPDPEAEGPRFTEKSDFPTYEFLQVPEDIKEDLSFDVIVIGSGAGGSVIAAELSKYGSKVLVIEKGKYYHQSDLTLDQADAADKLFENHGLLTSEDGSLNIFAGSTFGGSTTVNWSASLRPQHFVREEWAKNGLGYFVTEDYRKSLNVVMSRMGVTTENIVHNESNKVLIEGCKKLGFGVEEVPQNSAAKPHRCGWCTYGCKYGEKQGALMTFLRDAKDYGAKFLQDCYVEKVIVEDGTAKGVIATVGGNQFTIKSEKVIVAAGAIHSPAILLRSGLKNKNIGKNFYAHPTGYVYGAFGKEIKTYSGSILTTVSNVAENVDGNYYGAKLEIGALHPSLIPVFFPWKSALQHKQLMVQLNHIVPVMAVTRDKDGGRVTVDAEGKPRIHYTISQHDGKSMTAGIIAALKILVAAGAKKVGTAQAGVGEFEISRGDSLNDPKFHQYLAKVAKVGITPNQTGMGSAHQMGTCRMGANSSNSVVNFNGETWEVKNLYVGDASLFPSAIGVNPMVTIMSMAHSVAKGIVLKDTPRGKERDSIYGTFEERRRTLSMRITRNFTL